MTNALKAYANLLSAVVVLAVIGVMLIPGAPEQVLHTPEAAWNTLVDVASWFAAIPATVWDTITAALNSIF